MDSLLKLTSTNKPTPKLMYEKGKDCFLIYERTAISKRTAQYELVAEVRNFDMVKAILDVSRTKVHDCYHIGFRDKNGKSRNLTVHYIYRPDMDEVEVLRWCISSEARTLSRRQVEEIVDGCERLGGGTLYIARILADLTSQYSNLWSKAS